MWNPPHGKYLLRTSTNGFFIRSSVADFSFFEVLTKQSIYVFLELINLPHRMLIIRSFSVCRISRFFSTSPLSPPSSWSYTLLVSAAKFSFSRYISVILIENNIFCGLRRYDHKKMYSEATLSVMVAFQEDNFAETWKYLFLQ